MGTVGKSSWRVVGGNTLNSLSSRFLKKGKEGVSTALSRLGGVPAVLLASAS